ncbi:antiviral reverse transcriptase Drt5 [Vogesella indigofera]|uniref:antiviral reverse transcriptase Drt5 n=1 Tax=Vogesella indigofera TaxID=45465 RepID=UPI003F433973
MSKLFEFIQSDFYSTLFPMKTNLLMAEHHEAELSNYIYQKIINEKCEADNFLPQQRVHATKPRGHLRRTVKLDPIAEFFLYDFTYRNRAIFRKECSPTRRSFGYRFEGGSHVLVHVAYQEYKKCINDNEAIYDHKLQFDIASYFNSIYHHDISHWFASKSGVSDLDKSAISKFFREINSGRSIDFLPHGIYPTKMIGNEFLKFIDLYGQLKSPVIVRFMDDVILFGNDPTVLQQDFLRIQQLIGQYGLNVNPSKTYYDKSTKNVEKTLSKLEESLTETISWLEEVHSLSGVDVVEMEDEVISPLTEEQSEVLLNLLKDDSLEESDADLILSFLRAHSDSILEYLPILLKRFPNLIKHIHSICSKVTEKSDLTSILLEYLNDETFFLEYQIFWIACIVDDYLIGHGPYGDLLVKLFEISQNFKIAQAKILEIPVQDFGFKDIRSDYLKTGQSDWLSWASAMGTRTLNPAERNYALSYFANGSPVNYLIAECVKKF